MVGGLEHFLFFHVLGMSSSQLTVIFFRGIGIPPTRIGLDPLSNWIHGTRNAAIVPGPILLNPGFCIKQKSCKKKLTAGYIYIIYIISINIVQFIII